MTYGEAFATVKQQVSIRAVASYYGLEVGKGDFARCPFHTERTASLKLYEATGSYYCFGCRASGTQIDLTMQLLGLSSPLDALRQLDADFALGLELDKPLSAEERQRAKKARQERERRAKAAEALEEWRWSTATRYASYIQEANTLQHEPTTKREKALIRAREPLEYIVDILMGDDAEALIEAFLHRKETEEAWVTPLEKL